MSKSKNGGVFSRPVDRRTFLAFTAGAGVAATGFSTGALAQANKTGVDPTKWTPEYIKSIAGTAEYDTAAECYKIVPKDYKGRLTYWYFGPTQASPQIEHDIDKQFWEAFKALYPNIQVTALNLNYNEMIDKLRTAAIGKAAPMVVRLPILAGVEFAAKGQLMEFGPEQVGYSVEEFWPGAMKSVTWKGKTYGVPTNNETMALIWNAGLFKDAGLDPENAAGDLGRSRRLLEADQGQDWQERLRHGRPRQCRQYSVPLHAPALGIRRRCAGRG